ncbi:hypothetical protein [Nocardia asteroides]|uniref:hypothetical protein n=1 Tax=Nocardia asteroides TaxID=1824 RepID=UPI003655BEEC
MPIGNEVLLELARALKSPTPKDRERAADTITDIVHSLSRDETRVITAALAESAADETVHGCRESALHALVELVDTGFVRRMDLQPLASIDRDELIGSEIEYMEYLDDEVV